MLKHFSRRAMAIAGTRAGLLKARSRLATGVAGTGVDGWGGSDEGWATDGCLDEASPALRGGYLVRKTFSLACSSQYLPKSIRGVFNVSRFLRQ